MAVGAGPGQRRHPSQRGSGVAVDLEQAAERPAADPWGGSPARATRRARPAGRIARSCAQVQLGGAVAHRGGGQDLVDPDAFMVPQVRDRAGHPQHAVERARSGSS